MREGLCNQKSPTGPPAKSELLGHRLVYAPSALVINNVCVFCMTFFRTKLVASNHARKSALKGFCPSERVCHKYDVQESDSYACLMCDFSSPVFSSYCHHARSHLPPIEIRPFIPKLPSRPHSADRPSNPSAPIATSRRVRRRKLHKGDGTYTRSISARLSEGNETRVSLYSSASEDEVACQTD